MLDVTEKGRAAAAMKGPPLDFQEHLARLEARRAGDAHRPADQQGHRAASAGALAVLRAGCAEDERRAFLFTNVVDGSGTPLRHAGRGRRAGGLAATSTPSAWAGRSRRSATPGSTPSPIRSRRCASRRAPCQEVVIKGDDLRKPDGGLAALPVPISTPGFDAAPYLTATLCVTKRSGDRHPATWAPTAPALKATDRLGVRMASRIGGAGGYQHWQQIPQAENADADAPSSSAARRW